MRSTKALAFFIALVALTTTQAMAQQQQCQQQSNPYKNIHHCGSAQEVREGHCNAFIIQPTFTPVESETLFEVARLNSETLVKRTECRGYLLPLPWQCTQLAGDESQIKSCTLASANGVDCARVVVTVAEGREDTRYSCTALKIVSIYEKYQK